MAWIISLLICLQQCGWCICYLLWFTVVKLCNIGLEWGGTVSTARRWLQQWQFLFFSQTNSLTNLDSASDLYGSPPANNQHPSDLALCQSLQGRLRDVCLLQKKQRHFPLKPPVNWIPVWTLCLNKAVIQNKEHCFDRRFIQGVVKQARHAYLIPYHLHTVTWHLTEYLTYWMN